MLETPTFSPLCPWCLEGQVSGQRAHANPSKEYRGSLDPPVKDQGGGVPGHTQGSQEQLAWAAQARV